MSKIAEIMASMLDICLKNTDKDQIVTGSREFK